MQPFVGVVFGFLVFADLRELLVGLFKLLLLPLEIVSQLLDGLAVLDLLFVQPNLDFGCLQFTCKPLLVHNYWGRSHPINFTGARLRDIISQARLLGSTRRPPQERKGL